MPPRVGTVPVVHLQQEKNDKRQRPRKERRRRSLPKKSVMRRENALEGGEKFLTRCREMDPGDQHPLLSACPLCAFVHPPALGRCDKRWRPPWSRLVRGWTLLEWAKPGGPKTAISRIKSVSGPITTANCSSRRSADLLEGLDLAALTIPFFLELGKGEATWKGQFSLHCRRQVSNWRPGCGSRRHCNPTLCRRQSCDAFTRPRGCRIEAVGSPEFEDGEELSPLRPCPSACPHSIPPPPSSSTMPP